MSPLSTQIPSFLSLLCSLLSLQVFPGGVFSSSLWLPKVSSLHNFLFLPKFMSPVLLFYALFLIVIPIDSYPLFPCSVFPSSSLALLFSSLSSTLISFLPFWSGSFELQFNGQRKKVGIREQYWLVWSANQDPPLVVSSQLFVIIECMCFFYQKTVGL